MQQSWHPNLSCDVVRNALSRQTFRELNLQCVTSGHRAPHVFGLRLGFSAAFQEGDKDYAGTT